ncbi:MAG: hypothetical protein LLG14_25945 [Nocardiaceae bacterium]|nr:hypothetical protein [Nocardiaceae bacterium]
MNAQITGLLGPMALPPARDLEAALRAIGKQFPHSRVGVRVSEDGNRWTPLDDEPIVTNEDFDETDLSGTLTAMTGGDPRLRPIALKLTDRYIALRYLHSLGDPHYVGWLVTSMLATARSNEPVWLGPDAARMPLTRAAARTFGLRPSLISRALATREPVQSGSESAPAAPWKRSTRTVAVAVRPGVRERLREWGRVHHPDATLFTLHMVSAVRAFEMSGISVEPTARILFDLRRYLARQAPGNFVTGIDLEVRPDTSPGQLRTKMREITASGRPILTQAAILRHPPLSPPSVVCSSRARLAFSSVQASTELSALRLPGAPQFLYCGGVEPGEPNGLTVIDSRCDVTSYISASFHDNVLDTDRIQSSLDLLADDPIALLEQ